LVERGLCKPEVVGSNPIVSTRWHFHNVFPGKELSLAAHR